ncbi:MAG: S41 family peptidase [Acidobacteriota bacterium]|nr:S41 family peptidase [Acidobacteriota bacterium]
MLKRLLLTCFLLTPTLPAQLTTDQKVSDFNYLAGLYAKNYQPYQWKRDVIGFDLYNVKPWLDQVRQSKSDLEYYDLCVRYVAALQDSHDEYTLPSDYSAYLHFDVDIYDGAALVDAIDRKYLPAAKFPFRAGDEVVSVDGVAANELIAKYVPYSANGAGNASSRRRLAADTFTFREQFFFPGAPLHASTATVVIRRQSGAVETYVIPWDEAGTPILTAGPVTTPTGAGRKSAPMSVARARSLPSSARARDTGADIADNPWGVYTGPKPEAVADEVPEYQKPLLEFQTMRGLGPEGDFGGFGSIFPAYNPPAGFKLRLGGSAADQFLSGTFVSGSRTFGLIRIPTMAPSNTTTALRQFQSEIQFMQQNTDGLMIDVMRNGGGSVCYTESLEKMLIPHPFRSIAYEIRATDSWVLAFSSIVQAAINSGAETWVIESYQALLNDIKVANSQNRGDTGYIPICGPYYENMQPATNAAGNVIAYTKPILVMTDEFSLSAAEAFTMILQDEKRATVFGMRTDGGGGNPASYQAGAYSEGSTRVTRTFVTRKTEVKTPDFPASHYLENTGVYPDVLQDYMTKDNLLNGGKSFFASAVAAMNGLIE